MYYYGAAWCGSWSVLEYQASRTLSSSLTPCRIKQIIIAVAPSSPSVSSAIFCSGRIVERVPACFTYGLFAQRGINLYQRRSTACAVVIPAAPSVGYWCNTVLRDNDKNWISRPPSTNDAFASCATQHCFTSRRLRADHGYRHRSTHAVALPGTRSDGVHEQTHCLHAASRGH